MLGLWLSEARVPRICPSVAVYLARQSLPLPGQAAAVAGTADASVASSTTPCSKRARIGSASAAPADTGERDAMRSLLARCTCALGQHYHEDHHHEFEESAATEGLHSPPAASPDAPGRKRQRASSGGVALRGMGLPPAVLIDVLENALGEAAKVRD